MGALMGKKQFELTHPEKKGYRKSKTNLKKKQQSQCYSFG